MNTAHPTRRCLRLQISMRMLLIGVTICCVVFGVIWNWHKRSVAQRNSVSQLKQNPGIDIRYDYQINDDPVFNRLFSAEPSRIGRWLGVDYAHHVKRVTFGDQATDLAPLLSFSQLEYLSVNGVNSKNDWRIVSQIPSLKHLRIDTDFQGLIDATSYRSSVVGRDPAPLLENLHQLRNLRFLSLNCRGLNPAILQPIFNLPVLEELFLHNFAEKIDSNDNHSDSHQVKLPQSPGISKLHLVWPTFDSEKLKGLFHAVPNLSQLYVHFLIVSDGSSPIEGLDGLRECSQLSEIYFLAVDLRKLPDDWARLPLKRLGIGFCHLGDEGIKPIEGMSQLEYLQLNHNTGITDQGLETIMKVNNLKELSIIDTRVTDQGLLRLAKSKSLGTIHIRDTLVTREGIDEFRKLNLQCKLIE